MSDMDRWSPSTTFARQRTASAASRSPRRSSRSRRPTAGRSCSRPSRSSRSARSRSAAPSTRSRGWIATERGRAWSSSSGNHGQGVARAARLLGVPATVFMPADATAVKLERVRADGAEVITVDPLGPVTNQEAARAYGNARHPVHPLVRQRRCDRGPGHGRARDRGGRWRPRRAARAGRGWRAHQRNGHRGAGAPSNARIIGVEPELAADAQESFRGGELVAWPRERAVARSPTEPARTLRADLRPHPAARRRHRHGRRGRDRRGRPAAGRTARLVVEPTGALAVAAATFRAAEAGLTGIDGPVVALVSGGNVDPERYRDTWRRRSPIRAEGGFSAGHDPIAEPYGAVAERLHADRIEPDDVVAHEVVGNEQPGGGTATHGVRREHEADLVDEAGAEQRPIQLTAAVDTDTPDVVVGGEDVEQAGQVHSIGAGRQMRDPVTVEQREVGVGVDAALATRIPRQNGTRAASQSESAGPGCRRSPAAARRALPCRDGARSGGDPRRPSRSPPARLLRASWRCR